MNAIRIIGIFSLLLFALSANKIKAVGNKAKKKVEKRLILVTDNGFISLKATPYKSGKEVKYFLHNNIHGRFATKEEEKRLVTPEFFHIIKNNSSLKASFESILYFNASGQYVYKNSSIDDTIARTTKLSLLAGVAYSYLNTMLAKRAVQNSYAFVNDGMPKTRFHSARREFYTLSFLVVAQTLFYAFRAYRNYSRTDSGIYLNISKGKPLDSLRYLNKIDGENTISFGYTWQSF